MKKIIITTLILLTANVANAWDLSCLERLELRKEYARKMLPVRVLTLGLVGSINASRMRGTFRTFRILKEARAMRSNVDYSQENRTPRWKRFLKRINKDERINLDNKMLVETLTHLDKNKKICPRVRENGPRRHYRYSELKKAVIDYNL